MDPSTGVVTIGGTDHKPEGIGTAQVEQKDDQGCTHRYKLKKALYFPELLVNIISITLFVEQLQDNKGTFVTTKQKYSIFLWNNAKATLTIPHSEHSLPEIPINN
eukprot:15334193-Ditylum_brightwellii.AAC.1